uniref:Ig-like domain-containing protein n=1 Tax=Vombatus ursinus TaxID=29139 RepID=A0A4X2L1R2_VOMUR
MYPASEIQADLSLREGLFPFSLNLILMLLWISLLILAAAKKVVVIPSPPWTPVFKGEKVTLTCNGPHLLDPKKLWWFYENEWQKSSNPLEVTKAGEYRCEMDSSISDPVHLIFSNNELVLQIPYYVFEGDELLLRCQGRNDVKFTDISYFKDKKALRSVRENSVLSISHVNSDHSGLYYCKATKNRWYQYTSEEVKLHVQGIPVSGILLEIQPPRTQVIEGEKLVLTCSVAEGTGNITFCWHKNATKDCLRKKTQSSLKEEFMFSTIKKSDEGSYQCAADNNINTIFSRTVVITVMIPVSRPFLTLSAVGMQAVVGEVLEFRCEVLKGSAPVFYQFYHKGLVLKTILAPFGDAAFFNLSVTTEHSGNYSCEVNNSFSSQFSETLELSVLDPAERSLLIIGVTAALLSILGLAAVALLVYFKLKKKSGGSLVPEPSRDQPITDTQESGHSKSIPPVELQPIYDNVTPFIEDVIYSEVWDMNQGKTNRADISETLPEDKDSSVMYSEVKTHRPDNRSMDRDHEDDTENYENVLLS